MSQDTETTYGAGEDFPYVYMHKTGKGSKSETGVYGSRTVLGPAICKFCSANNQEDFVTENVDQMLDHQLLVHAERGERLWSGEGGNPGIKGLKKNAERLKKFKLDQKRALESRGIRKSKKIKKVVH